MYPTQAQMADPNQGGGQMVGFQPQPENVKVQYQVQQHPAPVARPGAFIPIKWTLIIWTAIYVILCVIGLILAIFFSAMIMKFFEKSKDNNVNLTPEEKQRFNDNLETVNTGVGILVYVVVVVFLICLAIFCLLLYGVSKEHFCLCVTFTVLLWLSVASSFSKPGSFGVKVPTIVYAGLLTYYCVMLRQIRNSAQRGNAIA